MIIIHILRFLGSKATLTSFYQKFFFIILQFSLCRILYGNFSCFKTNGGYYLSAFNKYSIIFFTGTRAFLQSAQFQFLQKLIRRFASSSPIFLMPKDLWRCMLFFKARQILMFPAFIWIVKQQLWSDEKGSILLGTAANSVWTLHAVMKKLGESLGKQTRRLCLTSSHNQAALNTLAYQ